jgi:hypothetical protein
MNTIIQIKIFHDLLDQFFVFLEKNFTLYKSDIILIKTGVDFIKKSNPRLVVEQFVNSVKPYRNELFDCNEKFFLDYDKNLQLPDIIKNSEIELISKIKDVWMSNDITENQKAYIWLYLQKLCKTGEKICK